MSKFELVQGDALQVLSSMNDESIDLLVTDPAYSSLEKHRAIGTTTRLAKSESSSNEWFDVVSNEYLIDFVRECYRVLKKGSHGYIMCDQDTGFFLKPELEKAGFIFWKSITWNKVSMGMGYHYRAQTEWILFFEKVERKGKHRQLNDAGISDLISIKSLRGSALYPTEKPVELLEVLINQSSNAGDVVFDGFVGSGATGEAALKLGRNILMCDTNPVAIKKATSRLAQFGQSCKVITPRSQLALL